MSIKPTAPMPPASLFDVTDRLEESFSRLNGLMNRMEREACSITERLQITIEIRQHIALAERTLAASTRAEAVNHFIEAVFESVKTLSATARKQFITQMTHQNSLLYKHMETAMRERAKQTLSNMQ